MSKGLAGTLLIAIVFLVTLVMGEGGPLDNLVGGAQERQPASEDTVRGDESGTVLASRVAPTPEPTSDALSWFEEDSSSAGFAQPQRPRPLVRDSGPSEEGALARHRQNLEE